MPTVTRTARANEWTANNTRHSLYLTNVCFSTRALRFRLLFLSYANSVKAELYDLSRVRRRAEMPGATAGRSTLSRATPKLCAVLSTGVNVHALRIVVPVLAGTRLALGRSLVRSWGCRLEGRKEGKKQARDATR